MLYKSGINLESGVINFINESNEITLFSAYIKIDELRKINLKNNVTQIIVRWELQDLHLGVSDIELYDYCVLNKISLYRNTRLHLKVFWNNKRDIVFGSANVTNKGLGEIGRYNFELNGKAYEISNEDILYFNKIISDSEYVDNSLYQKIKTCLNEINQEPITYPILDTKKSNIDYFLISQLPQTKNVDLFIDSYFKINDLSSIDTFKILHDIALYNLINIENKEVLFEKLKSEFNNHPFIVFFKNTVMQEPQSSMRFGSVRRWFAENTTTVPTPTPWDLNENVQVLYNWICYFDLRFEWSKPGGHSQVIFFKEVVK
jgi:hypothetical protein